jgi:hypothetical protein
VGRRGYFPCSNDFYQPSRRQEGGGEGGSTLWSSAEGGISIVAANALFIKLFINPIGINISTTPLSKMLAGTSTSDHCTLQDLPHTESRRTKREKKEGGNHGSVCLRVVILMIWTQWRACV